KPGADFTEVGKALLECGMPTPDDIFPENKKLSINARASIHACMIQSGFHYKNEVKGGDGVTLLKRKIFPFVSLVLLFRNEVSKSA
ncbi:hypothetical protein ME9_01331, partial [Bartonella taylorii 8TBB]